MVKQGQGRDLNNQQRGYDDNKQSMYTSSKFLSKLQPLITLLRIKVAATESAKLNRRQITGVRLRKVCQDIMDYIMLRAPQPPPGQSRKRFSLYLSSQLMYGVIKIYNKQHDYLLNDASTFMSRLRLATIANEDIDLKEAVNHDLVTLPDPVTMFQPETEYFDPLFGQIKENANKSLMAHERLQISSASESDQTITYSPKSIEPLRIGDVLGSPNTVSSIEEITMKEMSSLISRIEPLPTLEEDLLPGFGELFENLNERETDIPIMTEAHQSPIPHSLSDVPIVPVHETPIYRPGNELAKKHKEHPTPGITPEQQEKRQKRKRASVKLVLDDIDPDVQQISLPKKRKRLIIDKETQISREAFKKNLKNSTTSQPNSIIDLKSKSMGDFFKTPGRELSRSLLYCFQRNCKLPETIFLSDTDTSLTSSTLVTSPPTVSPTITAPVSISRSAEIELQQVPSMEVVRDLSISRSEVLPVLEQSSSIEGSSSISLNLSKLSDIVVPDVDSRLTLNNISAVIEEEPIQTDPLDVEVPVIVSPPYTKTHFKKLLEDAITEGNWTTFRSLVPTSKPRTIASKIFYQLLVAGAKGKISLTQEEPYGEIYISRFEAF